MYIDKQNELWIGTNNGFCKYDQASDKFIRFENNFRNNRILSILQDHKENFWFGTFGGGLNMVTFDKYQTRILNVSNYSNNINDEKTLVSDVISTLFEDRSHIMWIGSFLGLNKLDLKPKKFVLYKKTELPNSIDLFDNFIASIYKDRNDILWVGNWGKGLNLVDLKTRHVTHYSPSLTGKHKIVNGYVQVIFKDPDNYMWIGTRNGIQVLNPKDSSFINLNAFFNLSGLPEFTNVRIRKIYADSKKNIWICCDNGLYELNYETKKINTFLTKNDKNSISDNLVYDIIERKDGKLWIATVNGLNLYDPASNTFKHYFDDPSSMNSLSSSMTTCLLLDRDGDLWIGTNSGLNQLKKGSDHFIYFSKKDGLPDEYIYNIVEDESGRIWFSCNRGIASLNKKTKRVVTYNNEDGLQGLEFNGGACFQSETGELFFGGVSGLNSFYPNIMPINSFVPPVVITSFEKSNDSGKEKRIVHDKDVIELSYNDYEIVIEFAALDYTNSKAN
ncbi:MAG TPA: two-component regulator propeller domain-containing protein, partial [Bacteroidia bacterium]|nr:two-component regulator propeller domain-containing protein [Bacteroidia bacterium]